MGVEKSLDSHIISTVHETLGFVCLFVSYSKLAIENLESFQ